MGEDNRLATLRSYGVMDTPPEAGFDAIAFDAARELRCRHAVVSFINEDRQWYKARFGVDGVGVARADSFCTHTIESDEVMVVPDARLHRLFARNAFVLGPPFVRFYAAAPIRALNRERLGTVCVFDPQPRAEVTTREQRMLSALAARAVELLERHRWSGAARQAR
ncbi:hypothetical protein GCM10011380_17750 [Sphingomonas metalli]|uniref:GAF domain-containing protein n=1 Tax=Sphingomonas metalli TaxID=1779358 RepID=A0A916T4H0_9SPHN|nr:GAF domain-containing protein [Sphingomonas metalli]GGB28573.1 hypothetical protein GCM10011380_17750 [Sphingomonas metalli]